MHWLGLDWNGIVLNTVVLAIIPLLLAAWGGHLAAKAIDDPKRKRNVMLCFWALFVFGVAATFWQQLKSAQSDLARDTDTAWMEVVAKMFYPAPAVPTLALEKAVAPSKRSQADLMAEFAGKDDLAVRFANKSSTPAEQPKHWSALIDATNMIVWPGDPPDNYNLLPLMTQVWDKDYIRKDNPTGGYSILDEGQNKTAKQHVRSGDIITGVMDVTCLNCVRTRQYFIYFQMGLGGWYYPIPGEKPIAIPFSKQKEIPIAQLNAFIDRWIPQAGRIVMPQTFNWSKPQ